MIALQVNLYPALENENYCHQNLLTTSQLKHTHVMWRKGEYDDHMYLGFKPSRFSCNINGWRSIPEERWPATDEHTMIFNQLGLSRKINLPRQGSIMSFLEIKIYKILEIY